jgi:hypothetical protein
MESEKPPRAAFPYGILAAAFVCPILSSYLRRHHVGTLTSRALIVGLVAATLTLLIIGIAHLSGRAGPFKSTSSRFAPIIMAAAMALASAASDWISI